MIAVSLAPSASPTASSASTQSRLRLRCASLPDDTDATETARHQFRDRPLASRLSCRAVQAKPPALVLAESHELFAGLLDRNGIPPAWRRPASFGTLVRLILEQQVSLASAKAAYVRLVDFIGEPAPGAFLELSDGELHAIGFSRQKARYGRGIAERIIDGSLDPSRLASAGIEARGELLLIPGIGPWTVACFELFVSGLPDVWPTGDRALYISIARNLKLGDVPDGATCDAIAAQWAPLRSTAARMLWHDYLGGPSYVPDSDTGFIEEAGMVSS